MSSKELEEPTMSYDEDRISRQQTYLVKVYVVLRLATFFVLVPLIQLFWNKKSVGEDVNS